MISCRAGGDEAISSLSDVSVWRTLDDARRMDRFQPMLDLGEAFAERGAAFERPIMDCATMRDVPGRGGA